MGVSPVDAGRMSLWQYIAAVDGFAAANDPDGQTRLSDQERDEIWDWLKAKE